MQPRLVNHVSDTFLCKGTWNLNHKNTAAKCMQKNIMMEQKIETKKSERAHIYQYKCKKICKFASSFKKLIATGQLNLLAWFSVHTWNENLLQYLSCVADHALWHWVQDKKISFSKEPSDFLYKLLPEKGFQSFVWRHSGLIVSITLCVG